VVGIRLNFLYLGHSPAPKCKGFLSVRHPKYYKRILGNMLRYQLNSLNCSCRAIKRICLEISLHTSWSASSPTSAVKQRNWQSENITTLNLGGGNSSLPSVEDIFVHTDDTCSALETFSDSGLYKFTFYITLHLHLPTISC